jgi:LacI family transcriptional regulator
MGLEASRLILNAIDQRDAAVVDIRLRPELVIRGSTDVPRENSMIKF